MSGHAVLSAQMQHIGQVAAFKWLQRQPKLTHIIQRHMVRIRNACRSSLGRKSPIKILAQRLDPASCASLPFKNDRLEAQFAKLVGAGKTRQSSAHNDHFSLCFGRANKHCWSEGRCCCRCQEIPPVHHYFILISCFPETKQLHHTSIEKLYIRALITHGKITDVRWCPLSK